MNYMKLLIRQVTKRGDEREEELQSNQQYFDMMSRLRDELLNFEVILNYYLRQRTDQDPFLAADLSKAKNRLSFTNI